MKKIFSLLIILLLSISLISGCTNTDDVESDRADNIQEKNDGETGEEEEVEEGIFPGNKAYDFALLGREGNEISLSSLKGKVVLLNFWASWCGPCRIEKPHLQKAYEDYKEEDVVILAVNITASEEKGIEGVNSFLDENKLTFPVLYDEKGEVSQQYGVRSIPTTYIINKEGIIVNIVQGPLSEDMIKKQIETAME